MRALYKLNDELGKRLFENLNEQKDSGIIFNNSESEFGYIPVRSLEDWIKLKYTLTL